MAPTLVRPGGIAVLALLAALEGTVLLLGGLLLLVFSGLVGGIFSAIGGIIAGFLVVSAIFSFMVAYGYWNGFGWAWWVGLVLAIIGAIRAILTVPLGVISLVINGLIIYYLTRPYVQEYFGRSRPLTPPSPTPYTTASLEKALVTCRYCGAANDLSANFCRSCGVQLRSEGP
jgi:multisubunit Na+/H+ antiporter MnhB subunit